MSERDRLDRPLAIGQFDDTKLGSLKQRWGRDLAPKARKAALERALTESGIDTELSDSIIEAIELSKEKPTAAPAAGAAIPPPGYDVPSLSDKGRDSVAAKLFQQKKSSLNDIVAKAQRILKEAEEIADGQVIGTWMRFAQSGGEHPLFNLTRDIILGEEIRKALETPNPLVALDARRPPVAAGAPTGLATAAHPLGSDVVSDIDFLDLKNRINEYITTHPARQVSPREGLMVQIMTPSAAEAPGEPATVAAGPRSMRPVDVGYSGDGRNAAINPDRLRRKDEGLGKPVEAGILDAIRDLVDAPVSPLDSLSRGARMKLTAEALQAILERKGVKANLAEDAANVVSIMVDSPDPGRRAREVLDRLGDVDLLTETRMLQDHLPEWVDDVDKEFAREYAKFDPKYDVVREGMNVRESASGRHINEQVYDKILEELRRIGAGAPTPEGVLAGLRMGTGLPSYLDLVPIARLSDRIRTRNRAEILAKDISNYLRRGRTKAVIEKIKESQSPSPEKRGPGRPRKGEKVEKGEGDPLKNMSTGDLMRLYNKLEGEKSPKSTAGDTDA